MQNQAIAANVIALNFPPVCDFRAPLLVYLFEAHSFLFFFKHLSEGAFFFTCSNEEINMFLCQKHKGLYLLPEVSFIQFEMLSSWLNE